MIGSKCRRMLRFGAVIGLAAGLAAAGLMPSGARAQGYYGEGGRPYGYRHGYPYGGYGPQYGAVTGYYPGAYYAPPSYLEAPPVVYVQPRLRYAAPVRRIVHRSSLRPAALATSCSCALPHAVKPVALARPAMPAPAAQAPAVPPAAVTPPPPVMQSRPSDLYEPRPSAGD